MLSWYSIFSTESFPLFLNILHIIYVFIVRVYLATLDLNQAAPDRKGLAVVPWQGLECIGVTLVNTRTQGSGVQFNNTSSAYCVPHPKSRLLPSPFIPLYPLLPPQPPPLQWLSVFLLSLFLICQFGLFIRSHMSEVIRYLSVSDWFMSLAWCSPGPSTLSQRDRFPSFFTGTYYSTVFMSTVVLSTHVLMGTWAAGTC